MSQQCTSTFMFRYLSGIFSWEVGMKFFPYASQQNSQLVSFRLPLVSIAKIIRPQAKASQVSFARTVEKQEKPLNSYFVWSFPPKSWRLDLWICNKKRCLGVSGFEVFFCLGIFWTIIFEKHTFQLGWTSNKYRCDADVVVTKNQHTHNFFRF